MLKKLIRGLINDIRNFRDRRRTAMKEYYQYRSIMSIAPSFANDNEVTDAYILKDTFDNAIKFGRPSEMLSKTSRILLFMLPVLMQIGITVLGVYDAEKILPTEWQIPALVVLNIVSAYLIANAFYHFIFQPIAVSALKRRISHLDFWTKVAEKSVVGYPTVL